MLNGWTDGWMDGRIGKMMGGVDGWIGRRTDAGQTRHADFQSQLHRKTD